MIIIKPHEKRKNHVIVNYKGVDVADGIQCPSGRIEVRPREKHFAPLDRNYKVLTMRQIEELCEKSNVNQKSNQ